MYQKFIMLLTINWELKNMAKSERVVVILPSEIKQKLEKKAKDKSLSMSTYVKLLVTEDLRKTEKGN